MVTPTSFIDLADAEAYKEALQRSTWDYCGYNYFSRRPLNEPVEVYSSQHKVKRWIVVCRGCLTNILQFEKRTRHNASLDYYCCNNNNNSSKEGAGGVEVSDEPLVSFERIMMVHGAMRPQKNRKKRYNPQKSNNNNTFELLL